MPWEATLRNLLPPLAERDGVGKHASSAMILLLCLSIRMKSTEGYAAGGVEPILQHGHSAAGEAAKPPAEHINASQAWLNAGQVWLRAKHRAAGAGIAMCRFVTIHAARVREVLWLLYKEPADAR